MASDPRRQRLMLGGLLAVLAVVIWWQFGALPASSPAGPAAARPGQRTTGNSRPTQGPTPATTLAAGVALDRLRRVPAAPIDSGRDPFAARGGGSGGGASDGGGFTPVPVAPVPSVPAGPVVPPGPPPPPPIPVKFIGVVQRGDVGRVAVLSDGKNVYYGREGEIVDGRWRIVRIGEESLQIEHADGRGRQTVRLTG